MPGVPYTISGSVLDTDGSTALANAQVLIRDITIGEQISTTTDSNGDFSLDLSTLSSAYSNGDKLQILVQTARKAAWRRTTVDTGVGMENLGDIVMHPEVFQYGPGNSVRMYSYSISNQSATTYYVKFYDVDNDDVVLTVQVPANNTITHYFGVGLRFEGGICVIRESNSVDTLQIAMTCG